ncbi:hypothetical protein CP02DC14_2308B, partial [Chlamydia psittaci 02DC14]
EPILTG